MSFDRLISRLPAVVSSRELAEGETLFRQGDAAAAVFALDAGRVRLIRHTVDNRRVVLHTARPGRFVAEAALFSDHYHCDAVADLPSRLRVLSKPRLLAAFRADPELAQHFMAILAHEVMALRTRLELRNIRSAHERLLQHLLVAAGKDGRTVRLEGSLMDLAAEIGLTHEALYRALAKLESEGSVARTSEGLRVLKSPRV